MTRPLLSVVVPTRERADVLAETLEALLSLKNPDIELLICDNASSDATRQAVAKHSHRRIRYTRVDTLLTMPQNFARGLELATGEYVITLGDDDLLIEENLDLALNFAATENCDLVYWHRAYFYWGSYPNPELAAAFAIPTGRGHFFVDPHVLLNLTYLGLVNYQYLPSVYNSLCRRSFLKRYHDYLRGEYFPDYVVSVDVFSALVFCSLFPSVRFQQSPASVSGVSHRSNGMSVYTDGQEAGQFAKELGFSDVSCIMPDEYQGAVMSTTDHGIAQISILTDYFNVVNRLLGYSHPSVPRLSTLSSVYLRRLLQGGHIHVNQASELYLEIFSEDNSAPVVEEDLLTYFFRLWSIPAPQFYAARFESREATVRHLVGHLMAIGFNAGQAART